MGVSVFQNVFDMLVQKASYPASEGDYVGEDGLIHCGICGKKKQCRVEIELQGKKVIRTPPVPCDCRQKVIDEAVKRKESIERAEKLKLLRSMSLMDKKFENLYFSSLQQTKFNERPLKIARRYVERFDLMYQKCQGMLFYGPPGTGKSYLAAAIANELMEMQKSIIMTSFVKILDKTAESESLVDSLNQADLLIIDDLGAERETSYALERVYNVIDSRYRANKPMLLTTNLGVDELKNSDNIQYRRVYDRILEICYPVEFTGPSWRRKEAGTRYNEMLKLLEED